MKHGLRAKLLIWTAFLLGACAAPESAKPPAAAPDRTRAAVHLAALEMVDAEMREHYYDSGYAGKDWGALVAEARIALTEAATDDECHSVLNRMLAKLGRSHTAVIGAEAYAETEGQGGSEAGTPEPPEAAKAAGANETPPGADSGGPTAAGAPARVSEPQGRRPAPTTSGLKAQLVEGRPVITEADGPAAAAGLRRGLVLTRIGKRDVLRLASRMIRPNAPDRFRHLHFCGAIEGALSGRPGDEVEVCYLDAAGTEGMARIALAADERPRVNVLNLPPAVPECRSRILDSGYGYVTFDIFFLQIMPRIREAVLGFADAPGIVLDLRGNPGGLGGMAIPVAALFVQEEFVIGTMKQRDGELRFPVAPAPRTVEVPLVVLVDGRTASTSEILASGLQEAGRAIVVGTPTAGGVLPSILKTLPTGGRFQYPVADFVTSGGRTLEGEGVIPDVIVPLSQDALLAGRDNVLDAAVALLRAGARPTRRPSPPPPAPPAAVPAADARPLPKADDILEAHVTATGGREAYGRLTSSVAHFSGGIPQAGMDMSMFVKTKAPNLMSMHMEIKDVMEQRGGYDGKVAWSKDQMLGLRELKGAERAAMVRESTFNSPLHWKTLYKEVRTKELKKLDARECVVVELVPEEGEPVLQYYDLETKLLVRQDAVMDSPMGQQKIRTTMSDYKDHECGVKMAHSMKITAGPMAFTLKASKIEVNVPIDDSEFKMPAAEEPEPKKDGGEKPKPPGGEKPGG